MHRKLQARALDGTQAMSVESGLFLQGIRYDTGPDPSATVAVADLDNDGNLDLLVPSVDNGTVRVLLGNSDGSFRAWQEYAALAPIFVTTGDFNGDGKPDLMVVNQCESDTTCYVSVLLGNGDGTFQSHVDYLNGINPVAAAVGDFNGDGKADLAVVNCKHQYVCIHAGSVSILLGNGDGTFQAHVDYPTGSGPSAVVVVDLNADGKPDLAVADGAAHSVSILLGNGDGSFQLPLASGVGQGPGAITAGDFNGDGKPDLAVANFAYGFNTMSVLLGHGDGTFQVHRDYSTVGATASTIGSIAAADFNGDGIVDLQVSRDGCVSILMGNGDGTFAGSVGYSMAGFTTAVGDFNHDGRLDLASELGEVLLGAPGGTFPANRDYPAANYPMAVAVQDLNGDGNPDVAISNCGYSTACYGSVSVLLGNADGTFQYDGDYLLGIYLAQSIAIADLNRDGHPDLITEFGALLGNGDGTFQDLRPLPNQSGIFAALGDFDGDGKLDLVAATGLPSINVFLGNGDGTFRSPVSYATGPFTSRSVAVSDFNGDGKLDLAVVNGCDTDLRLGTCDSSGSMSVLLGNGDGTFQAAASFPTGGGDPSYVVAGDLNLDGKPDLAIVNNDYIGVSIFIGNGDGTFQGLVQYPAGGTSSVEGTGILSGLAIGDFNGDGKSDLALAGWYRNVVSVLLGNGDGTLQPSWDFTAGTSPLALAVADFNGDGALDLATGDFFDGTVTILLNLNHIGTGVDLRSSANPVLVGQVVTFTATVKPVKSGTPTGSLTFLDGTISLGTFDLDGSGTAAISVATLGPGSHNITASYIGDSSFSGSSSPSLNEVVVAPDFSATAGAASPAAVSPGESSTAAIMLASQAGFNGSVALTCSVTPTASPAPTCNLSPVSVSLLSGGSASSTLTIGTTAPMAIRRVPPLRQPAGPMYAAWLTLVGAVLLTSGLGTNRRRKGKRHPQLLALSLLCGGLLFQSACGGGSSGGGSGKGSPGTPAANYTVTLTATSGSLSHTASVALTVR